MTSSLCYSRIVIVVHGKKSSVSEFEKLVYRYRAVLRLGGNADAMVERSRVSLFFEMSIPGDCCIRNATDGLTSINSSFRSSGITSRSRYLLSTKPGSQATRNKTLTVSTTRR
jgi:hypothetical protein